MSKFRYEIYVVSDQEYQMTKINDEFRGGVVINGMAGLEDDALVLTAHAIDKATILPRITKLGHAEEPT